MGYNRTKTKMKFKNTLILSLCSFIAVLFFSSCATTKQIDLIGCDAKFISPDNVEVVATPILADIEVSEERFVYDTVFRNIGTLENIKPEDCDRYIRIAKECAAVKYHADVIVSPVIQTNLISMNPVAIPSMTPYNLRVRVTGHVGIYKNFRNATKEDGWILDPKDQCFSSENNSRKGDFIKYPIK